MRKSGQNNPQEEKNGGAAWFCEQVRTMNAEYEELYGRKRAVYTETYGCQQNESDSELFRGMASDMGYRPTDRAEDADLIVFNTCAVREHAELRVLGNIGALSHLKKKNPQLIIIIAGCMMSQEHMREKIKKSYPYVGGVLDTSSPDRLAEAVYDILSTGRRSFIAEDGRDPLRDMEELPRKRDGKVRAWLPVMKGCDNFCSYCIVPFVRGRESSREAEKVVAEARDLIAKGYKEITLLGQNVNSYAGEGGFPRLLREINAIEGEFRIRFMTSHPKDAGDELFDAMRDCEKVSKHLHLPFQSGSDRILKAMNRGYTAALYREKLARARERMPGLAVTSDVIVGFPGETEADFEETLDLVRDVGFSSLYTFIYSKRRGTRAAELPENASKEEIKARFQRLLDIQNGISAGINARLAGRTVRVLVEDKSKDEGVLNARTDDGTLVLLSGEPSLVGRFLDARVTATATWSVSALPAGHVTQ